MLVYRLEHRNLINQDSGMPCGPYNVRRAMGWRERNAYGQVLAELCDYSFNAAHLPPDADPLLVTIHQNEVCGFVDLPSALQWFGPFVARLERFGFHLTCYNVPDDYVRTGLNGQCVFSVRHAHRVLDQNKENARD